MEGASQTPGSQALPKFIAAFHGQDDAATKCLAAVRSRGYGVFALQSGGECWSGAEAEQTYHKHGTSDRCKDGKGGPWASDVYFVGG